MPLWIILLYDFSIFICAFIAVLVSAARYAQYALVVALEWAFFSGILIKGFIDLNWWQLLLLMILSCYLIRLLINIEALFFSLCIASSIIVIEFMIIIGMEIVGSPVNTRTGVFSTIATVIGTIVVVWYNYDDVDPIGLVDIPIVNVLVRILSSGILALAGYIFGGQFLPSTLGMFEEVQYGIYNAMGLPIAISFFVISFIAFSIKDRLYN